MEGIGQRLVRQTASTCDFTIRFARAKDRLELKGIKCERMTEASCDGNKKTRNWLKEAI